MAQHILLEAVLGLLAQLVGDPSQDNDHIVAGIHSLRHDSCHVGGLSGLNISDH